MENYIVRIYRREKDNPRRLIGLVERVGQEHRHSFMNLEELWRILNTPRECIEHRSGKRSKTAKGKN